MEVRVAFVLLAILAEVYCSPLVKRSINRCATECIESTKLKYEAGSVYEYHYEADTLTTLQGSAEEHSSVHIKATAVIEAQSQCELVLRLRDVTLEESDPRNVKQRTRAQNDKSFREALQAHPLIYSFQDGRVVQLCGSEDESAWVMNVKRGVLSAFQNSMEHMEHDHTVSETDVAGNCQAQYKIAERSSGRLSISKSKNLLGCTDRQHHLSAFQGTAYRVPSEIQSLPLMKSTHNCQQTFGILGHLEKSECHENHVFRPFSKQVSGASTKATQIVRFLRRHNRIHSSPGYMSRRTSMLFDHMKPETGSSAERREAEAILKAICQNHDTRPDTPLQFSQLVAHLRTLDSYNIRDLHERVHNSRVCENNHERAKMFFTDAIPMVSTAGSLALVRELMQKGEVTGVKADAWMTTIAFIAKPTLDMLREIKPLLDNKPRQQTVLAISTLVNAYCRDNSECSFESEVQDITSNFLNTLARDCSGEHDHVLLALKALGNAGAAVKDATILNRCIKSSRLDMETRIAAINAFRRLPCTTDHEELMTLLKNKEEDSEPRIGAYLSIMRCPASSILSQVRKILESEEINQVGSFIWTHLTNLKETSDPLKQDIRKILEDEPLKREFNLDQRKFSRNSEASVFFNSINTGAQVESNIIWSPKSYVPRSTMFNLTVDMFGQSVNLMEFGSRIEGMEKTLETLFGPDGYFKDNKVSNLIKRGKRSARDPISRLRESFDAKAQDAAKASMYMKMFGNEMAFLDNHNFDWQKQKDSFNFLELLIKLATDHKVDFSKSAQFLDTSTSIPTMLGLPLKLSIKGTATVDVHISGHADLRKVATKPRSLDVKGYIKPSGAVEITGLMSIDVAGLTSGLKMISTLHSSTTIDGTVTLNEEKALSMRFNMPEDKIDILNVETKFFVVGSNGAREQKMITEGRTEKKLCSGFLVQKALGVKVCGEVSVPQISSKDDAPFYPFTGPTTLKAYILKTDTHAAYTFDLAYERSKEAGYPVVIAKAGFNTPGSKIDRDFGVDLELKRADKTVDFSMRTPWKKVSLSGALTNKKALKTATVKLTLDKGREYSIAANLKLDERPLMVKYTPSLQLSMPGRKDAIFKGYAQYKKNKRVDVDLALTNIFKKPVNLKGAVSIDRIKNKVKYFSNLQLSSQFVNIKTNGFLDKAGKRSVSRVIIAYTVPGKKLQRFVVNTKLRDLSNKVAARRNMNIAFQTSQFPDYNSQVTIDVSKTIKRIVSSMDFRYGPNWKDMKKRVYLQTIFNYAKKGKIIQGDYNMKMSYKAKSIDIKSKGDFRHSEDESKALATIQYKPGRLIKYNMALKRDTKKPIRINAIMGLSYPGRQMAFSSELIERAANNFHHECIVQWQRGKSFRSMTVYTKNAAGKHDIRSEITLPKKQPITLAGNALFKQDNFAAKAQVEYNSKKYGSAVSYSYDFGKKPAIKAAVDLTHPIRHITANVEVAKVGNNYRGRIDTKWDADNDASKRVLFDGAVLYAIKKDISLKIKYPGRLISMNLNHAANSKKTVSHGELTWAPTKKITVDHSYSFSKAKGTFTLNNDIHFTSPFENFENLKASSSIVHNALQLSGKGKISWTPGKEIDTKLAIKKTNGWNNFNGQLTMMTPFDDMKTVKANINHKFTKTSLTCNGDIMWNKNKAEMNLSGKMLSFKQKHIVEGSMEINTPFKHMKDFAIRTENTIQIGHFNSHLETERHGSKYQLDITGKSGSNMEGSLRIRTPMPKVKDVSVSGKLSTSGNRISNSLEVSWAKDKTITFNGNLIKTDNLYNTQGNGKFTTPFNGYEKMAITWQNQFSANKVKARTEVTMPGKKVLLDIDGSHDNTYYSRDINAHILLKTPYSAMDNIDVTFKHHMGQQDMKTETEVIHHHNKALEMLIEGDISDTIMGKFLLKTPLKYFKDVGAHINVRANNPYNGHIELQWTPTKKMALDGEVTLQGLKYGKGEVRFTSPFSGLERIVVNGHHTSNDNGFTVIASTEYATNKKVEVRSNVNLEKGIDAELNMKTPCSYFKDVSLSIKHNGKLQNFNNEIKFNFQGQDKVTFNSKLRAKAFSLINGNLRFTSPYEYIEEISAKINHRKQGLQWTTDLEIAPTPRQKVNAEVKLQIENGLKAVLNLKTPFQRLRQLTFDAEHNGAGSHFDNKAKMELFCVHDRITFTSALSVAGPSYIVGNAKLVSTKGDIEYSINLRHNKNGAEWVSHAEVGLDARRKITLDTTFEKDNEIKLTMALNTPFDKMRRIASAYEVSMDKSNMLAKAELDYSQWNGKVNAEIVLNKAESNINGHALFTSPFDGFEKVQADFDHTIKSGNQYNTHAGFEYQTGKKITITTTLKAPSMKRWDVSATLITPFYSLQTATVSYKHRGEPGKFNCHAEMQYNNEMKTQMDIDFDSTDAIMGNLKVRSPYRNVRDVHIGFNHEGSLFQFETKGKVIYNGKKIESSMSLVTKPTIKFNAMLTTPFEVMQKSSVSLEHIGNINSFETHIIATYEDKSIRTDVTFNNIHNIDATMKISTPFSYFKNVNFNLHHEGHLKAFTSNAELVYDNKKIHIEGKFNSIDNLEAALSLMTPFENFEDLGFTLKHEGNLKAFESKLQVMYNKKNIVEMSANFNSRGEMRGTFRFASAIEKFEELIMSFRHRGNMMNFRSHAELTYAPSKTVMLDARLNTQNKIEGLLQFRSPFQNYENIFLSLDHQGALKDFTCQCEFSYAKGKAIKVNGKFASANGISGEFKLTTPFETLDTVDIAFSHKGDLADFESHGELSYNGKEAIQIDAEYTKRPNLAGKLQFRSPFAGYTNWKLVFGHTGTYSKFSSSAALTAEGENKLQIDTKYQRQPMEASIKIRSPLHRYVQNIDVIFKHHGSEKSFDTYAELRYLDGKILYKGKLDFSKNIIGEFLLKTPHTKDVSITFNQESDDSHIVHGDASYGSDKVQVDGELKKDFSEGHVHFISPVEQIDDLAASYKHNADGVNFHTNAEFVYRKNKKVSIDADLSMDPSMSGTLRLQTPFEEIRDVSLTAGQDATKANVQLMYNGKKYAASAERRASQYKLLLTSPDEKLNIIMSHRANKKMIRSDLKILRSNKNLVTLNVDLRRYPSLSGRIELRSALKQLKNIELNMKHQGNMDSFKSQGDIRYGSKRVSGSIDWKTQPAINLVAQVDTPFENYEHLSFNLNHHRNDNGFATTTKFGYSPSKEIEIVVNMNAETNNARGNFQITTPIEKFENLKVSFRHDGPINNFRSHGEATYGQKKFVTDVVFDIVEAKEVKVTIMTPYESLNEIVFNGKMTGELSNFQSEVSLKYAPRKIIALKQSFKKIGTLIQGTMSLTTPFNTLQTIRGQFKHTGDLREFNTNGFVIYGREKLELNSNYKSENGIPKSGGILITSSHPMLKKMGGDFALSKTAGEYEGTFTTTWAPGKSISINTNLNKDIRSYNKNIQASIKITTPFEKVQSMGAKYTYSQSANVYSGKVDADFNERTVLDFDAKYENKYGKKSGELNIRTPRPSSISAELENNKISLDLNWDTRSSDKNIQLAAGYNGPSDMNARIVTPTRTTSFTTLIQRTDAKVTHKHELVWDEANQKKVLVEGALNSRSRGNKVDFDINGKIKTPIRSMELSLDHDCSPRGSNNVLTVQWDAERNPEKKLTLKSAYEKTATQNNLILTISHPQLERDIILKNELALLNGNRIFHGLTELKYTDDARDNIIIAGDINSLPVDGFNYTLHLQMTHRKSLLDSHIHAHVGNTPSALSAGMIANYMTTRRRTENLILMAQVNKLRKQLRAEMITPLKSIEMIGNVECNGDEHTVTLQNTYDRTRTVKTVAQLNTNTYDADLKVYYDPEERSNLYHAYLKYETPTEMKLEAYRLHDGKRTTDAQLDMDLKNRRLLHSRLYLRPSMYNDMQEVSTSGLMDSLNNKLSSAKDVVSNALLREFRGRHYYTVRMLPDLTPVQEYLQTEASSFANDYETMTIEFNRMVQDNEFYMRDIARAYTATISQIRNGLIRLVEFIKVKLEELKVKLSDLKEKVQDKYQEIKDAVAVHYPIYKERVGLKLSEWSDKVAVKMQPVVVTYNRIYDQAAQKYNNMLGHVKSSVYHRVRRSTEHINTMRDYYNGVIDWTSDKLSTPVRNVQLNVKQHIRQINAKLSGYANTASQKVNKALDKTQEYVNKAVEKITDYEYPKYAKTVVTEVFSQGKWLYDQLNVKDTAHRFAMNAIQTTMKSAKDNAAYILSSYLHLEKDKLMVYDPKKGVIEFQVYIPVNVPQLKSLPNYHITEMWNTVKNTVKKYTPTEEYSIWDTFYKYTPSRNINDWIPPFKAYGVIAGNQHYITFDKRHFEFAGQCSYILAADMVNVGSSAVYVNYNNGIKRSLTVLSEEKRIEIPTDYKVTVDNKLVDLPVQVGSTTIRRVGNELFVEKKSGMTLKCDITNDVCIIGISGWFYGKVGGLLGTYDNEPTNDFLTSDRRNVETPEELASSWLVSGSCRTSRNLAHTYTPEEGKESFIACALLFHSKHSPFRPCFKVVEPAKFFKMCVNDYEEAVTRKGGVCKAAASYVAVCKKEGVPLRMPRRCVKCESKVTDTFREGEDINLETPNHSADVVFVVEERKCNKKAANKLRNVMLVLDKSIRQQGLKNNRFGLVGFGGKGVHDEPNTHTMDGHLFGGIRQAIRGISNLEIEGVLSRDVLQAVRMAARYPFRVGVSKTIVLLTCSDCSDTEVTYKEMLRVLSQNDIHLHILRAEEFKLTVDQKTPKTTDLFGIDADAAFTSHHVTDKKLAGDKELFNRIVQSSDVCMRLAQVTGGSVFNINKLTEGQVKFQKHFIDVLSRRVARSAKPASCQTCECNPDATGAGVAICRPCYTPRQPYYTQIFSQLQAMTKQNDKDRFDMDYQEYRPVIGLN